MLFATAKKYIKTSFFVARGGVFYFKIIIMYTKEFEFKNGDEVIEKITGFRGTITGTAFYLTGCTQHLITAKCEKEGKEPIALWYDEGRLEFIKNKVQPEDVKGKDNGCDLLPNIGMKGN